MKMDCRLMLRAKEEVLEEDPRPLLLVPPLPSPDLLALPDHRAPQSRPVPRNRRVPYQNLRARRPNRSVIQLPSFLLPPHAWWTIFHLDDQHSCALYFKYYRKLKRPFGRPTTKLRLFLENIKILNFFDFRPRRLSPHLESRAEQYGDEAKNISMIIGSPW